MADVVSIVHPVPDLDAAEAFFAEALRLPACGRGEGWLALDNGAFRVRLAGAGPCYRPRLLELEIEATEVDEEVARLCCFPGVADTGCGHASSDRVERRLAAPHGLTLVVFRMLTEDDLDVPPPLPSSLPWEPAADALVRQVLRAVPLAFRDGARTRVTEQAEIEAVASGEISVSVPASVRGLFAATPPFQHAQLRAEVARHLDARPLPRARVLP